MGFSCTIKAGKKELTKYPNGEIHCQLLGLGPNSSDSTDAPYRVVDLREVVSDCVYGAKLEEAAQDCFKELQHMVTVNLESLVPDKHCESCTCPHERTIPKGWSIEECEKFLSIDYKTITHISGGY